MKYFSMYTVLIAGIVLFSTATTAHDLGGAGLPVCLEGNFMVADSGTGDGAGGTSIAGPGRILELDIMTGRRGVTLNVPFPGP